MKRSSKNPLIGPDEPQLGLFDEPPQPSRSFAGIEELEALGRALPARLRLGTSSWTFPGWAGLVYHRRYSTQRAFLRESLAEYAKHPLMRTVGIDRSYYAPVPEEDLRLYAGQLPDGFRCAMKVWQRIAMPVFPRHARYGAEAGKKNPDFLNAEIFAEAVHQPVLELFCRWMGPWILEIAPSPARLSADWFLRKLDDFLRAAPRDFPFAVELRERSLLSEEYASVLRERSASHVFNYWSRMPGIAEQIEVAGLVDGDPLVARLLLPPGARYDELRDAYAPFDALVDPRPGMHRDVQRLIEIALERDREIYVLVNNKAEGSSPLTIRAIAERIAR